MYASTGCQFSLPVDSGNEQYVRNDLSVLNVELMNGQLIHEWTNQVISGKVKDQAEGY